MCCKNDNKTTTALLIQLTCIFGVTFVGRVEGNYIYTSSRESRSLKRFKEYQGLSLIGKQPYSVKEKVLNYRECTRTCDINKMECQAVNVLKTSDTFTCSFFRTSAAKYEENPDMIYISKDPPACFTYCRELEFLDLCGTCKCTDICGSVFSHFCDCTEAVSEPKKNCKELRRAGFKEPAMYNFKNSEGGQFHGFCEIREDPNVLWLTMFRQFKATLQEPITMDQLTKGFGKPHNELHWLGLEQLYHFTKNDNTILRIEVATFSHHYKWYGEYGNFKITRRGTSYGYTASNFRSNFCLWDGLNDQGNFAECDGSNPWDGTCVGSNPLEAGRIKWGGFVAQRITFLLRHGSLPTLPMVTNRMGVKIAPRVLGEIEYFGMDFCISFNLYTNKIETPKGISRRLLCFMDKFTKACSLVIYNAENELRILHRFIKSKQGTTLAVKPTKSKWINLKISQMQTTVKGQYKMRLLVDDIPKGLVTLGPDLLEDQKHFQVVLARSDGNIYDGLIHGIFINGRQYL